MQHKLGVIVPYRNRYRQLVKFKESFHAYMRKNHLGIDYSLIIVEQDDSSAFNRGKLLNIGFVKAKELKCDYVIFHDVDMLPMNVDYSFSNKLNNGFIKNDYIVQTISDRSYLKSNRTIIQPFSPIKKFNDKIWK